MKRLGFRWPRARPPLPPSRRRLDLDSAHLSGPLYAIGDVHGCLDLLLEAEARIRADLPNGRGLVVLLGDYVDRGPKSSGVIDHLTNPEPDGLRRVALCGNHDDAFLKALDRRLGLASWFGFGGRETLMSYGIDVDTVGQRQGVAALMDMAARAVPPGHLAFLRQLPVLARSGDYVFVHAGVRPGRALSAQLDEDLMWIREPFLSTGPQLPFTIVHGHTISPDPVFAQGRIGIDTGAYASGRLTVLKIEEDRVSLL